MRKTTVERVRFPKDRRVLVLSDIHGHIRELDDVLERASYSADDILVIVGDMIEKGPESLKTLRRIMALQKTRAVYPLMGNVDYWRYMHFTQGAAAQSDLLTSALNARRWWGSSLLHECCAELNIPVSESMDIAGTVVKIREAFAPELAFMDGLPTILDTPDMIFVHGGIPHENLSLLEGTDCYPLLKCDDFLSRGLSFHKYVTVGHWPATLYRTGRPDNTPLVDSARHIICLDGGCGIKDDGQLNLMILPANGSENFSFLSSDSLPKLTALDDQTPSRTPPQYIKWTDRFVTLLESAGDEARVLWHGREMRVPSAIVRVESDGRTVCGDITDYRLAVKKGDTLSLVYRLHSGCYVKKNGQSGWYFGRLADKQDKGTE